MDRKGNRKIVFFAAAWMLVGGAGIARGAQQDTKTGQKEAPVTSAKNNAAPPADTRVAPVPATTDPAYVIGAEDVLDIDVWKEPDMTRTVPVRPDGRISLPLINDVQAAGLTPLQLSATLTESLRKYLTDPQVTVIVTAMNSQRVFVVGEVLRAGAFPLISGMTVLQALSSSGGFTTYANIKKIHIMRKQDGKQIDLPFNYRDVVKGDKQAQNIKLQPGDTIVVP